MDVFTTAAEFLRDRRPERPVLALRPHAALRAANWFLANFPGRVLYAAKANDAPLIVEALVEAGIRSFDVASLVEIERLAPVPGAELYFMNPIKSRGAIVRAYRDFGVRSFAFDSDDELDKIVAETGGAEDLNLFLRVACPNTHSLIPLEGKFGVSSEEAPALLLRARQLACRLGITFHVGSQAVVPAAFGEALRQVGQLIVASGVLVDAIDIGGGFPSRYPHSDPPELASFMDEVVRAADELAVRHSCELLCEPGRALVAEAESVIVRVDARRPAGEDNGRRAVLLDDRRSANVLVQSKLGAAEQRPELGLVGEGAVEVRVEQDALHPQAPGAAVELGQRDPPNFWSRSHGRALWC